MSKNSVLEFFLKKWNFASNFKCTVEDRSVVSVLCKFYSSVTYDQFYHEAKTKRGIESKIKIGDGLSWWRFLRTQPSEFGKKTDSKKMPSYMKILTAKHKLRRQKHAVMY